jgi:hypothetical protein
MTSKTGDELRALAAAIERVKSESPVANVAQQIVNNCTDHLRTVARLHDMHALVMNHD